MLQFLRNKNKMTNKRENMKEDSSFLLRNSEMFTEGVIKLSSSYFDYKSVNPIRIYSEAELKEATNNYHSDQLLHDNSIYVFYKGIIQGDRIILVKMLNEEYIKKKTREGFSREVLQNLLVHEIVVSSQINNRNIVKFIGCCLETRDPVQVNEFCFNTTLFSQIHGKDGDNVGKASQELTLSWENRLRISIEVAGAITYLHTALSRPLVHRNIWSATILLDQNFAAKLFHLPTSVSIPFGKTHVETYPLRNLDRAYLAPEQWNGRVSEKTDVYSFGVLLLELITGFDPCGLKGKEMIMSYVNLELDIILDCVKMWEVEDGVHEIREKMKKQQLQSVAELAVRCTRSLDEERPTMLEAASALPD